MQVEAKHKAVSDYIESLPVGKDVSTENLAENYMQSNQLEASCHNKQMLLLKATSQTCLLCVENALALLQEVRTSNISTPIPSSSSGSTPVVNVDAVNA